MNVTDLFTVRHGHRLDLTHLALAPEETGIAYVSCTDQNNGVSGWVERIEGIEPAEAGTISVATVGATLAAHIQPVPYYTAQNVEILTPLDPKMTLAEKLWWASCIRANRFRFNYGRKANRTFRSLELPEAVPEWVTDANARAAVLKLAASLPTFDSESLGSKDRVTTVGDLFAIRRGHKLDLVHLDQVEPLEGIAYVSRSEKTNGVVAWVKEIEGLEPGAPGTITVALGGNSVMAAYVQPRPYYTAQNVDILTPLDPAMTLAEKLWWTSCVLANRYRYNYGRHANRTFRVLALPGEMPIWAGSVPHDATSQLRETVEKIGRSIGELSGLDKTSDLMTKLFRVKPEDIKG